METPPPPGLIEPGMEAALARWERAENRRQTAEEFDRAVAVFSGEVIGGDLVRVRFKLDRAWKGKLPNEFFMSTGAVRHADGTISFTSCDFGLPLGSKLLIFGFGTSIETMQASSCTHSTALEHAGPTIEVLDELVKELTKRPRGQGQFIGR